MASDLDAFVSRLKSIEPRFEVSDDDLVTLFWQAHPRFQYFKSLPWGANLLDVGAGNGGLALWKHWGQPSRGDLSLYGVDLTVGQYCDLYAGWEAINLDKQPPNFPGVKLDSFFVSHLIEHLAVPDKLLQWLAARAEPGAKVYIEWQNPTSINLPTREDLRKFGIDVTSSNFKDDGTRQSSPDPAALCRWLSDAGFTLISSGTIDLGDLGEELFARAADPGIRTMGYQSITRSLLYAVAVKPTDPPAARAHPAATIAQSPGSGSATTSTPADTRRRESRTNSPESSYESRVASQIAQYSDTLNINELPKIFHYWSETYLAPRIEKMFGTKKLADVICNAWLENEKPQRNRYSFASLGAGDCSIELGLAQQLLDRGIEDFEIHAFELSEPLIERARSASRHLEGHLRIVACDINDYEIEGSYDGMMAHHSLHHFVNLERIFDNVKRVLAPNGNFVVWDMIGRNGHMRWPECLSIIERLWSVLPLAKRYNHQTHETWREFINFDCSGEGFEGIRAQDILPCLLERFHASHFAATGGITEVFLDRSFGHNFNPEDEWDRGFVDLIEHLNSRLIECGAIKPTLMYSTFKTEPCDCRHEGHLTPEFCLRSPA